MNGFLANAGRITLVFLMAALASGALPTAGATELTETDASAQCSNPLASVAPTDLSEGEIEALLQELHAIFAGLAGFVDVYYYEGDAFPFRPMFEGVIPEAAYERGAPIPLGFDVVPQGFQELDPGTTPSVADVQCGGIRPGARIISGGAQCTLAWILKDATNTYAATAGHCISVGQISSITGVGVIGTAVFSTGDGGVGNDFALIKINANVLAAVKPEMCDLAGPTGTFAGFGINAQVTAQTGHGAGVISTAPRPKYGVGQGWGATSFTWIGSSIPGDSGSPIRLRTGQALGVVTHLNLLIPVLDFGTRLSHGLSLAAAGGFPGLVLQTVPYTHL